jgi:hypothetical protein
MVASRVWAGVHLRIREMVTMGIQWLGISACRKLMINVDTTSSTMQIAFDPEFPGSCGAAKIHDFALVGGRGKLI